MNIDLKAKADLMTDNYYELKKGFKWEANLAKHFGALIHAINDKRVDINALEKIRKYIKSQTGTFSNYRGTNGFILSNLLYLEDNYKMIFNNMLEVSKKMKEKKFKNSAYSPLAAYTIAKEVSSEEWNYRIDRMRDFYNYMKQNHFWLTSSDDYVLAAVLAISDLDAEKTSKDFENCYRYLNDIAFRKSNDLQTLSHILAIGEESVEIKCKKTVEIYKGFKEQKLKLAYSSLATLGVLALVTSDIGKIVKEVLEVYDYINNKKGYGAWSIDKSMRAMLAASLVTDAYVEEIKKGVVQVALGNSINAIIIAQQQAMIAAACAASAAAASASS